MLNDLKVFKTAYAMATHAGKRQAVISQNIANADTPGYRARDIAAFSSVVSYDDVRTDMRASRPGHVSGFRSDRSAWREFVTGDQINPNNNSVSVENEMLKAVETRRQHDRALAIYKSSLNILRTSLGRF
ncbi:FlgB family protein [Primorskyibacter sp. S87]|uniref:FlgB family protein n=1 Tax=Primorskyibacter sp. S87 TaxID=3415126 RepID=UPI003C7AF440